MIIRHLLDTSTCIQVIRRRPGHVVDHLTSLPPQSVGISTITLAELQYGVCRSTDPVRNAAALAKFLAPIVIMPFDQAAAGVYGVIRTALEASGKPIGPLDMLIAAHALSLAIVLVTGNVREFRRVPGLVVEDWSQTRTR